MFDKGMAFYIITICPQIYFKREDGDPLKLCPPKCVDALPQSATDVEQREADIEVQVDHNGDPLKCVDGPPQGVEATKYSSPKSKV